jgi:hypothetical protein
MKTASATTRPAAAGGGIAYYGGVRVATGQSELIDQLASGSVKLSDLKDEQLSPEMRKMTKEEREAYVAAKQKERAAIQAKIAELSKARANYLDEERKRLAASGKADAFDEKVNEMLSKQAAAKRK